MTDCKNCKYTDEYCASGDCPNDKTNYDILKEYEAHKTPVPSYEEWKASEKYNKHLEEKIKIYERKDKQATETSMAYNELAKENEELKEILERHKKATAKAQIRSCDLEIINKQLKELLKECKTYIENVPVEDKSKYMVNALNLLLSIEEVLK